MDTLSGGSQATRDGSSAASARPPGPAGAGSVERDLLEAAAAGDDVAFERLYRLHGDALRRYCHGIVRWGDVDDVMQDVALATLNALRRGERPASLRRWLFRVARNRSLDEARRRPPELALDAGRPDRSPSVEDRVVERDRLRTVIADLHQLSRSQRLALVMSAVEGRSLAEIATRMNASPSAAKHLVHEGRRSLAAMDEGRRTLTCESVRARIARRDGRLLRARKVRAHLRGCAECRELAARRAGHATALAVVPVAGVVALARRALEVVAGGGMAGVGSKAVVGAAALGALGPVVLPGVGDGIRAVARPEPAAARPEPAAARQPEGAGSHAQPQVARARATAPRRVAPVQEPAIGGRRRATRPGGGEPRAPATATPAPPDAVAAGAPPAAAPPAVAPPAAGVAAPFPPGRRGGPAGPVARVEVSVGRSTHGPSPQLAVSAAVGGGPSPRVAVSATIGSGRGPADVTPPVGDLIAPVDALVGELVPGLRLRGVVSARAGVGPGPP